MASSGQPVTEVRWNVRQLMRLAIALALALSLHLFVVFGLAVYGEGAPRQRNVVLNLRLVKTHPKPTTLPEPAAVARAATQAVSAVRIEAPLPHADPGGPSAEPPAPAAAPDLDAPASHSADASPLPWFPSLGVIEAPDLNYYPPAELDQLAKPVGEITPYIPLAEAQSVPDGRVLLMLLIDETGRVDEVQLLESNPPGMMDEVGLAVWRNTRFTPAMKGGKYVRSRKKIEITFGDGTPKPPLVTLPAIAPGSNDAGGSPQWQKRRDR